MYQIGLKLWSTNKNYISEAIRLYNSQKINYIELFSVPGSFQNYITIWKKIKIPFIIHAPHSHSGLNPAKKEFKKKNLLLAKEAIQFAHELESDYIIFHPGIDGEINETITFFSDINNGKIIIENKPYFTIDKKHICIGHSPEEISNIINKLDLNFCLDIGHAIYSANAKKIDPYKYINNFLELKPKIIHLTDGNINGIIDQHLHFGSGSFDISKIMKLLPKSVKLTIETIKSNPNNLKDFEKDINYLKNLNLNKI
ncbi:MAG: sugar phosphate isomerase/epimerase [Spirochaetes bacterium]|nr:sugar phosphate isomerase/epimerase [Spirochaetota bacterium]